MGLWARRFLLCGSALFLSLDLEAFRLPFPLLPEREVAEGRCRTEGRGGSAGAAGEVEPVMADSGTRRRVVGSTRLEALGESCWVDEFSRFGSPRAAAAQERRVDKLARRAAS